MKLFWKFMESSPAFLPEKELMDSPASLTFFCKSFGYLPTLNILLRISLAISLGIPTGIFIGKLMFFHDFFQDFLREFILEFLREVLDEFIVNCWRNYFVTTSEEIRKRTSRRTTDRHSDRILGGTSGRFRWAVPRRLS